MKDENKLKYVILYGICNDFCVIYIKWNVIYIWGIGVYDFMDIKVLYFL